MGGETIRVDTEALDQLVRSIRKASMHLGSGASVPRCDLSRAPEVQSAWNELSTRWDENQRKIAGDLDVVANALEAICGSFRSWDADRAASLEVAK